MSQQRKVLSTAQVSEAAELTGHLDTVSSKIRALDNADWSRADIARALDKRYQHVKNVLDNPLKG